MKKTVISILTAVIIGCFIGVLSTKQLVSWVDTVEVSQHAKESSDKVSSADDSTQNSGQQDKNHTDIALAKKETQAQEQKISKEYRDIEEINGFAYQHLSDNQKEVYVKLLDGIENHQSRISVTALDNNEISSCIEALLADRPEFFWISGDSTIWSTGSVITKEVELTQNVSSDQIATIQATIEKNADAFLATVDANASDYEKVRAVYEYVILNTDYNLDIEQNQNIQSVFLHHESVCAGYAKATQYLLNRMGMYCAYISGKIDKTGEYHAWNLVRIDGKFYYVDTTWGDPTYSNNTGEQTDKASISYDYLCIRSDELFRTHTPTNPDILPECVNNDANYYVKEGLYYNTYDKEAVEENFKQTLADGKDHAYAKFANADAYHEALNDLFENHSINDVAQVKIQQDGISEYRYYYYLNDDLYIIKMSW